MSYDYTLCDNAQCRLHDKCQRYALWQRWLTDESSNKPPQVSMLLHATNEPVGNDCKLFWQITTKTL